MGLGRSVTQFSRQGAVSSLRCGRGDLEICRLTSIAEGRSALTAPIDAAETLFKRLNVELCPGWRPRLPRFAGPTEFGMCWQTAGAGVGGLLRPFERRFAGQFPGQGEREREETEQSQR